MNLVSNGYISGSLKWRARSHGEIAREVVYRFIFYEKGILEKPKEKEEKLDDFPREEKRRSLLESLLVSPFLDGPTKIESLDE